MCKINECDGGIGMGDITFPGENGNSQGSGDLPKSTGTVYTQVMPFSKFVQWKQKYKKNKKSKITPDSYKKLDNPPEYKHVYNFQEYVQKVKEEL